MKSIEKRLCPKCGSEKTKKYGFVNQVQRYKCNNCNKTFLDVKKRIKYNSKEKALLSLLINFLNCNREEKEYDIHEIIKNISENDVDIEDFRLITKTSDNSEQIKCYAPKLLICEEYNKVTIYKIPNRSKNKQAIRTLTIIDDDSQSEYKKRIQDKMQQENKLKNKKLSPSKYLSTNNWTEELNNYSYSDNPDEF